MSTTKHRQRRPGGFQYLYDGRQLIAALEQKTDGWHVVIDNRDVGVCADREAALRLANTILPANKECA